jgi:hypothetical protein
MVFLLIVECWAFYVGGPLQRETRPFDSVAADGLLANGGKTRAKQPNAKHQQLYHLIDNYSKDQLPLPLASNQDYEPPAFKRILFWNTVSLIR